MIEPTALDKHVNAVEFIAMATKAPTSPEIEALLAQLPITPEGECEVKGSDTKEFFTTPKGRKVHEFPANGIACNINPSNFRPILEFAPPPLTKAGRPPALAVINIYMADQEPQGWLIRLPQDYVGPYTEKSGLTGESTVVDVLNDW